MNNINLFSLRCPYFIYYIDRNKMHRELCSIFEIRIMLKRCLSPLKGAPVIDPLTAEPWIKEVQNVTKIRN